MNFEEQYRFFCSFYYLFKNGSGNNGVLSENLKIIFAVYFYLLLSIINDINY